MKFSPSQLTRYIKFGLPLLAVVIVMEAAVSTSSHAQEAGAGLYQTDSTIAEIMDSIVMPSADVIWNSVVVYSTKDGLVEEKPETDDDWAKLRWSAVSLAESTNLLMMPGRMVNKPGVVSQVPDAELNPDQIQALIKEQTPAWNAHASALHGIALQTIKIIDNKDTDGLSDIGGAIDEACESCHLQFWYPNQ